MIVMSDISTLLEGGQSTPHGPQPYVPRLLLIHGNHLLIGEPVPGGVRVKTCTLEAYQAIAGGQPEITFMIIKETANGDIVQSRWGFFLQHRVIDQTVQASRSPHPKHLLTIQV